jgi:hypothetical protein
MARNLEDPRRFQMLEYVREARLLLENALAKPLDHTDVAIVLSAYDGLSIVLRLLGGTGVPSDAVLAARLRAVATSILECSAPEARIAYSAIEAAAGLTLAMAECK